MPEQLTMKRLRLHLLALGLSSLAVHATEPANAALPAGKGQQRAAPVAPQPAKAEEDPSVAQHASSLDQVVITGTSDPRRTSTGAITVFNREDINRFGDNSIADVLNRLPGISFGERAGGTKEVRMRGLGSGYVQFLLNGDPAPPGFSLETLSPDMVERIEVLRGASAEQGGRAIAGSINIVLKTKVHRPERELKIGVAHEAHRASPNVGVQIADRAGSASYTVGLAASKRLAVRPSRADESSAGADGTVFTRTRTGRTRRSETDQINASPRVTWTLGQTGQVVLKTFLDHLRDVTSGTDAASTDVGDPPRYPKSELRQSIVLQTARADLAWNDSFEAGGKLNLSITVNGHRRKIDARRSARSLQGHPILDRRIQSDAKANTWGSLGKYSIPVGDTHSLGLGWDAEFTRRSETRDQTDVESTNLSDSNIPGTATRWEDDYVADVARAALYVQDEWSVNNRWSVYWGARWEQIVTRSASTSAPGITNRSRVLSPSLQLLCRLPEINAKDQLRLALSRTYRAPETGNLMNLRALSLNNSMTSPDSQGNPDLKAELAWGLDLSYDHYFGKSGLLSASLYARQIDNVISSQLINIDGRWVTTPVNNGRARSQGMELDMKVSLKELLSTAPDIELRGNLTRNWSKVNNVPGPRNRLDQQVPLTANAGVNYRLSAIPLRIGGNLNYQASTETQQSGLRETAVSARRALDVFGLWEFNRHSKLRVTFANILRQDHVSSTASSDQIQTSTQTTEVPSTLGVRVVLEMKL